MVEKLSVTFRKRCTASVCRPGDLGGRGCERYAAEEVEGRIYCRQHAKKARERAENRRKAAAR